MELSTLKLYFEKNCCKNLNNKLIFQIKNNKFDGELLKENIKNIIRVY